MPPFAAPPRRRVAGARADWVDRQVQPPAPSDEATGDAVSWFDSSWVLRSGLQITEHATVNHVANDLPLGWWLEGPGAAR